MNPSIRKFVELKVTEIQQFRDSPQQKQLYNDPSAGSTETLLRLLSFLNDKGLPISSLVPISERFTYTPNR